MGEGGWSRMAELLSISLWRSSIRDRGSGPSWPAVSSGRPVLLSRKSSSRPTGTGCPMEPGPGSSEAWWLLGGEGQAGAAGGSFPAGDDCSLKSAEISVRGANVRSGVRRSSAAGSGSPPTPLGSGDPALQLNPWGTEAVAGVAGKMCPALMQQSHQEAF